MGTVYLVGAGPGDPGLLTRRGAALLRRADVIVHDALVSDDILALAAPRTRMIDVGKRGGGKRTDQRRINRLLIEEAGTNSTVVRLKGGDPFVFGRGGEEAQALAEAGVPFEVVPGVTAGLAAPAYAGIPATHRGVSSSVTLVTGHDAEDAATSVERWRALARIGGTIVVYMATQTIDQIARELIAGGMESDTPAAAVAAGTCAEQRTLVATLEQIGDRMRIEGIAAPAVVIIGNVVSLREEIQWWEQQPLVAARA